MYKGKGHSHNKEKSGRIPAADLYVTYDVCRINTKTYIKYIVQQ